VLKVNNDREHGFLGNYLPFVYHCLADASADVVSTPELQRMLREAFGLELPQAILWRLLHRAADEQKVTVESGVYSINRPQLAHSSLSAMRAAVQRGYHQLLTALVDFAADRLQLDWSIDHADQLVAAYVDRFSSAVLASALEGQPPAPAQEDETPDSYVVHRFVAYIHTDDQMLFEFLETTVKGRMLADALYFEGANTESTSLSELEVYFDGPLLLHILGYGGPEIRAPYVELIDMLRRQGALLRCFTHNAAEAEEILDAAAQRAWAGRPTDRLRGDVVSQLVRSKNTRSDIELMAAHLQRDLLRIGIQTVDTPGYSVATQIDEQRLEAMLQQDIGYLNSRARTRDIESLTAIHRLRGGRLHRDLAKSGAVFVTRNYDLFRTSMRFFETRSFGRVVPHCVVHAAFTVLIWLREPLRTPELPRDRIIADAYAALNPTEALWSAYNREVTRLKQAGRISDADFRYLRMADEARVSLMDLTRGDDEVFTEGTPLEVLERSQETAQVELRDELRSARDARDRALAEIVQMNERIERVAKSASKALACVAFTVLIVALALGVAMGPVGPIHARVVPGWSQAVCAAFAVGFALWTAIDRGSLLTIQRALYRVTLRTLNRLLFRWLAPDPPEPPTPDDDGVRA
jgi:hypothetical protein